MLASFILQEIIYIGIEKVTLYIRDNLIECLYPVQTRCFFSSIAYFATWPHFIFLNQSIKRSF